MIATRIPVTVLSVFVSAIKEGPVTLRVAASERLISVTVALFEGISDFLRKQALENRSAVLVE